MIRSSNDQVDATFESLGLHKQVLASVATLGYTAPLPFQRTVLRHTVHDFADVLAQTSPQCGKHTALAIFASHAVLSSGGKCALVVCQSATSCARIMSLLKKMNIEGLRFVSCLDDSGISKVGEGHQIAVGTLQAFSKIRFENVKRISCLLVDDVDAYQTPSLRELMEEVTDSSPTACMFLLSSREPSQAPLSIRYMLRRSKRRYFFEAEGTPHYTFLMCHDQRDRSDINCRLSQLSGLRRVIILTHNKEVRDLKAFLHQQLGFRTYSLQRNTSPVERERILGDFLDSQYAILVAMDAFVGIDMMDVDALIQYYPPQKSMADEEWSEYISCLNRTGDPSNPTLVCTIVGPEDFSLAAHFMKRVGVESPVLNVAPSHTRFADIVRYPELVAQEKTKLESGELPPCSSQDFLEAQKGASLPLPRSKQDDVKPGKGKKNKDEKKKKFAKH